MYINVPLVVSHPWRHSNLQYWLDDIKLHYNYLRVNTHHFFTTCMLSSHAGLDAFTSMLSTSLLLLLLFRTPPGVLSGSKTPCKENTNFYLSLMATLGFRMVCRMFLLRKMLTDIDTHVTFPTIYIYNERREKTLLVFPFSCTAMCAFGKR